jgi:hypothetical protein
VAIVAAALGPLYGWLWSVLAPKLPVVKLDDGQPGFADPAPEQWVSDEGWFVVLGIGIGIVAGLAAWWLVRRRRGPVVLVALAVGAVVGGILAWWVGHRIGLSGYEHALAQAAPGTRLYHPPALRIKALDWWPPKVEGVLLVEAVAAVATYTLLAGWSRYMSLRPEAPEPALPQWALSWDSPALPDRPAEPAPPAPGGAAPPHGPGG